MDEPDEDDWSVYPPRTKHDAFLNWLLESAKTAREYHDDASANTLEEVALEFAEDFKREIQDKHELPRGVR